jgi:hypothetical protein
MEVNGQLHDLITLPPWKEAPLSNGKGLGGPYNKNTARIESKTLFISMVISAHSGTRPFIQFCNHFSYIVKLLGQVISPLQGH